MEKKFFILLLFIFLLGFFSHTLFLQKTVYGDGIFYYSWLRSTIIDHDVNFTNEYHFFGAEQPITPLGFIGNKYAIGPALLWAPNYLWIHTFVHSDGFSLPYQITIGITSVFYTYIGLLLLFLTLKKFTTEKTAFFVIAILAFTTNLLFYGSLDTVNSHALSFFAVSLFLALLFQKNKNWIAIGCTVGIIALIRPQDSIVAMLIIPFLKKHHILKILFFITIGTLPFVALQIVIWHALYGVLFVNPYLLGGEGFSFFNPHVLPVLFNIKTGLLTYTPMLLVGFAGFFFQWKYQQKTKYFILGIIMGQLYLISTWSTWWQGASYGCRMFIGTLPLFIFPLSVIFSNIHDRLLKAALILPITIIAFALINMMMILYTLLTL